MLKTCLRLFAATAALSVAWLSAPAQSYPYEWLSLGMSEDPSAVQRVRWRTPVDTPGGFAEVIPATPSPDMSKCLKRYKACSSTEDDYGKVMIYHHAEFDSLSPGRSYLYRIGDGGRKWSEWYRFSTAGKAGEPFGFIYISDVQVGIHDHYPRIIREATTRLGGDASFIMFTGDMTGAASEWEWNAFFRSNGWLFGMMPVVAIPDSHEYTIRNNDSLKTLTSYWPHLFSYPRNTPEMLLGLGNYYYDYQGCRFVMINTRELEDGEDSYRHMLLSWMENLFAANPHRWCIVGQHRPVYSVAEGRNSDRIKEYLKPLYDKYDVDLVLTGHDHIYARMRGEQNDRRSPELQGPVYVVSIAGSQVYMPEYHTYVERMASNTQLFHGVNVCHDKINFKSFLATGELYDEFDIVKGGSGKKFVDMAPDIPEIIDLPFSTWKTYTDADKDSYRKKSRRYLESKTAAK